MNIVLGQSPKILRPPFPAWKQHYVICVEQALSYGLNQVKTKKTSTELKNASERLITYWLLDELQELMQKDVIRGFTRDVFELPHLDSPTENADETSIQNMPDLRFNLTASQTVDYKKIEKLDQYAWYCECKIIEQGHSSRTYKNYWDEGVQRFVDGRYARHMPHAQMIAYVRWPSHPTDLGPGYTNLQLRGSPDGDICITKHSRKTDKGLALSDIQLRHLWFKFQ